MATKYSDYYKGRVLRGIVGHGSDIRKLYAFGVTTTGKTLAAPTTATLSVSPSASTLGAIDSGNIPFAGDFITAVSPNITVKNSAASATLTIPAGTVVHYIGIATASNPTLIAYVQLTNPDNNYYYEEQGTLTVPANGYTIQHG